jgi:chemotaxis signal transduction protein
VKPASPPVEMGVAQMRRILDLRTASLANRGSAAADVAPSVRVMACAIGHETYGVPLSAALRVLPARPLAPAHAGSPALLGFLGHAGRLYGVLDLGAAVLAAPGAGGSARGHLLLLRDRPLALRVDGVLGVADVVPLTRGPGDEAVARGVTSIAHAAAGMLADTETLVALLDLDRLLAPFSAPHPVSGATL